MRPTAAPRHFPYRHRTVAQVDAANRANTARLIALFHASIAQSLHDEPREIAETHSINNARK